MTFTIIFASLSPCLVILVFSAENNKDKGKKNKNNKKK